MNKNALIKQLISLRASVEGIGTQIDAALSILIEGMDECDHKNRLNLTVMGGPEQWQCKDCGFLYSK